MPHVTLIHGISNKPPPEDLLRIWRETLANATEPVPLGDLGVTSSLVYWADLLYEKPDEDLSAYEGVLENTPQAVDGAGGASAPQPRTLAEAEFLDGLRRNMTGLSDNELDAEPPPVPIQRTIRQRFVDALCAPTVTRPHIVVSHSMGTVIAYDCLKRVAECANVDGLITIGSPLGLDEIQDKLQPGWTRPDGFPHEKVSGSWVNVFDRLDPVAGFDPLLANDFREGGQNKITDINEQNHGAWRHSIVKYLRGPRLREALSGMLGA